MERRFKYQGAASRLEDLRTLSKLGCTEPEVRFGLAHVHVECSHPEVDLIRKTAQQLSLREQAYAVLNKNDFDRAEYFYLTPGWNVDPPETDYLLHCSVYEPSSLCRRCGAYKIQKHPFVLTREPRWGNRVAMGFELACTDVFVRKDFYEEVLAHLGVNCWPVVNKSTKAHLKTAVQIVTDAEATVDLSGVPNETCIDCGRSKYAARMNDRPGWSPPITSPKLQHPAFVHTGYWVGARQGMVCFRWLLVNRSMYNLLRQSAPRSFVLTPWLSDA